MSYRLFVFFVALFSPVSGYADVETGLQNYSKQDFKGAFKEFEQEAKAGNAYAQLALGALFEAGTGVSQSFPQALAWFQESANQGRQEAMEAVGIYYAIGRGVKQDLPVALDWFLKATVAGGYASLANIDTDARQLVESKIPAAKELLQRKAEQGDPVAQTKLGFMYLVGMINPKDIHSWGIQAEGWLLKAAEKSNKDALYLLGRIREYEMAGTRDQIDAVKWYQLAANQGLASAQFALSKIYSGDSSFKYSPEKTVKVDPVKALEFAKKASEAGYPHADTFFARLMLEDTKTDLYPKAITLLEKALKDGDMNALILLGDVYLAGRGIPLDSNRALSLYRRAAIVSEKKVAYRRLAMMYEAGKGGVPKDPYQAYQYYEESVEDSGKSEDAPLHLKLAKMSEEGIGTEKNTGKALQHYRMAGLGGSIEAMKKMELISTKGGLGEKPNPKAAQFWKERLAQSVSK